MWFREGKTMVCLSQLWNMLYNPFGRDDASGNDGPEHLFGWYQVILGRELFATNYLII